MTTFVRERRWIALFAAYAVALQVFFLPLTVAAFAEPGSNLCVTADGSPAPADHGALCPCAAGCGMQCAMHAFAAPPAVAGLAGPPAHEFRLARNYLFAAVPHSDWHAPHSARAPPLA